MAGPVDPTPDGRVAAHTLALLEALSIMVKGSPAGGAAKRLADLKRVEDLLREVRGHFEGPRRSWGSQIEVSLTLLAEILLAAFNALMVLAIWRVRDAWDATPWVVVFLLLLLVLGAVFFAFEAWTSWRTLRGSRSVLVLSKIKVFERALPVEKQKVYQELAKHPDVRRQIVGDAPGDYSIGVTKRPGGGDGLAFHVVGTGGAPRAVPPSVEIDGLTIPVVVAGGCDEPQLL